MWTETATCYPPTEVSPDAIIGRVAVQERPGFLFAGYPSPNIFHV